MNDKKKERTRLKQKEWVNANREKVRAANAKSNQKARANETEEQRANRKRKEKERRMLRAQELKVLRKQAGLPEDRRFIKSEAVLIKITLVNGDYWVTRINLPLEQAKAYYLGKPWGFSDNQAPSLCISVELL